MPRLWCRGEGALGGVHVWELLESTPLILLLVRRRRLLEEGPLVMWRLLVVRQLGWLTLCRHLLQPQRHCGHLVHLPQRHHGHLIPQCRQAVLLLNDHLMLLLVWLQGVGLLVGFLLGEVVCPPLLLVLL